MQPTRAALAATLLALALPAQGAEPKPSLVEFEKLTAEWKAANDGYRAALAAVTTSDEYKAAREAKDNAKARELTSAIPRPDAAAFGARALALADQYAGEDSLKVLVFAATTFAEKDVVRSAVERVQKRHLGNAGIVGLMENAMTLSRFLGPEDANAFLDQVIADNKHALPRAWAMYWKAFQIQRDKGASDAAKATADKLLADAEQLAVGTDLADRIAAPRFEKEHLQPGMQAPEIEGTDLDGVAFKLSDYRGKVVLLDFWGFW